MKQELDKKLVEDFPNLYQDRYKSMQETAMCWGFDVDDGWYNLIRELSEKLEKLIKLEPEDTWAQFRAVQVKEKFGSLRFYMSVETEEMEKEISNAEDKSSVTCEFCGNPGTIKGRGWLKCVCPEHTKV